MKKLALLLMMFSLVGCAGPTPSPTAVPTSSIANCAPKDLADYSALIMPIYTRWAEAIQKAYSMKPVDLSPAIASLIKIDEEFKGIFPPACLSDLHKKLLAASDYHVKDFNARFSGEAEAKVADLFARGNAMLSIIASELMKISRTT